MLTGKSKLRNPVLADVFHKMGMIEKWGTGLPRIFARCANAGISKPQVVVGGSTVTICFQRSLKTAVDGDATLVGNVGNHVGNDVATDATLERVVVDCLRGDAKMSAAKMSKVAHVTTRTIERVLARLKASGRISRNGGTRGHWEVLK